VFDEDYWTLKSRIEDTELALALDASFPTDLRDFVAKCLLKKPEDRWTATQLLKHPYLADVPDTSDYKEWEVLRLFLTWSDPSVGAKFS